MKKSFIKSLLIVVMALLLVFTLVACDKPENDGGGKKPGPTPPGPGPSPDDPTPSVTLTAADYFDKLWTLTSEIGEEKVAGDDDIALEFGLEFAINTRNSNTKAIYHQIDLGFDIQAVIGRTIKTADNTALKVKLYDPSDKEHTEILALYLLASDLDNLYIDFGGKHIQLPHNLVSTVWNEVLEKEDKLSEQIPAALSKKLFKDMSVNDIINGVTSSFGEDWNLNALITSIAKTFGLDLKEMLSGFESMISTILLGGQSLFDKNGNIDLYTVLTSEVLQSAFVVESSTANGVTTYKAALGDGFVSMIGGVIDGMLDTNKYAQFESVEQLQKHLEEKKAVYYISKYENEKPVYDETKVNVESLTDDECLNYFYITNTEAMNMVANLFGAISANREFALTFHEKNNTIQDFTISALLGGLAGNVTTVSENGTSFGQTVIPEVAITISSLKIAKANDENKVKINPADYKTSIALDEQMAFEVSGITIKDLSTLFGVEEGTTSADKEDSFTLNHRVEIGVQGQIDLVNGRTVANVEKAEAVANQTQLYAYVRLVDLGTKKVTNIVHASFANGKLAVQVEENLASEVVKALKEMGKDFGLDGVNSFYLDLSDFNIADEFHDMVVKIAEGFFGGNESAVTAADKPQAKWVIKTFNAVKAALKYVKTNNDLVVSTDDVLKSAIEFTDILYAGNKDYTWTVAEREKFFVNMLNNPPLDPEKHTIGELLTTILTKVQDGFKKPEDPNGNVQVQADEPSIKDCALTALYLFAQHVELAGVELTEEDVKAGTSYYDKAIVAVLHCAVEIKGDAKDGLHLSVTVKVKDTHITIAEKLEVIDTTAAPLTDLYKEYEALVKDGDDTSAWKNIADFFPEEE
ncbi:MAG: hypothetical protein K2J16_07125 [Clostridia bacterium]|nr:hypothetical protein [Clostridia bacterium]